MVKVGTYMSMEVFRDKAGTYYLRVPAADGDGFGAVHDLHRRVPVGRFSSFTEMTKAMGHRRGVIAWR